METYTQLAEASSKQSEVALQRISKALKALPPTASKRMRAHLSLLAAKESVRLGDTERAAAMINGHLSVLGCKWRALLANWLDSAIVEARSTLPSSSQSHLLPFILSLLSSNALHDPPGRPHNLLSAASSITTSESLSDLVTLSLKDSPIRWKSEFDVCVGTLGDAANVSLELSSTLPQPVECTKLRVCFTVPSYDRWVSVGPGRDAVAEVSNASPISIAFKVLLDTFGASSPEEADSSACRIAVSALELHVRFASHHAQTLRLRVVADTDSGIQILPFEELASEYINHDPSNIPNSLLLFKPKAHAITRMQHACAALMGETHHASVDIISGEDAITEGKLQVDCEEGTIVPNVIKIPDMGPNEVYRAQISVSIPDGTENALSRSIVSKLRYAVKQRYPVTVDARFHLETFAPFKGNINVSGVTDAFEAIAGQPISLCVKLSRSDMPPPYNDAEAFIEVSRVVCVPASSAVRVLGSALVTCSDGAEGAEICLDSEYTVRLVLVPLIAAPSLALGSLEVYWKRPNGIEVCTALSLPTVAVKEKPLLAGVYAQLSGPAVAGTPFNLTLWMCNNSDAVDEYDVHIATSDASDVSPGVYAEMFDHSENSLKRGIVEHVEASSKDFAIVGPLHCRSLVHPHQSITLSWQLVPLRVGDCAVPSFFVSSRRRKQHVKIGETLRSVLVIPPGSL